MLSPIHVSIIQFLSILAVVSTIAAFLIHKLIPAQSRVALRPVTQPALTVVGMMFSILVGYFIAQAMRDYAVASSNVTQEANAVGSVFRLARGLGDTDRPRIRQLCRDYVETVVKDEWPLMAESGESPKAWEALQKMWEACLSVNPADRRQGIAMQTMVTAMEHVGEHRRARIASNYSQGMSLHLWIFLSIGAAAIVSITFMFAPESKAFHVGILCCILVPLTVNAYMLAECSYPFSGAMCIKPTMFAVIQKDLFTQPDTAPRYLTGVESEIGRLAGPVAPADSLTSKD